MFRLKPRENTVLGSEYVSAGNLTCYSHAKPVADFDIRKLYWEFETPFYELGAPQKPEHRRGGETRKVPETGEEYLDARGARGG